MTEPLEYLIREPQTTATHCVIWLHGLGADGHDFESIVPQLGLPEHHGIRFIFPHAPLRPITINQGSVMRGWYDIYSLNDLEKEDEAGIKDSCQRVFQLLQKQQAEGIPTKHIILAGFSQGGAIALYFGLTQDIQIGGIIALSTYLPFAQALKSTTHKAYNIPPTLLCHGEYDDVIPVHLGEETKACLEKKGANPEWHTYTMGHQVCTEEIQTIGRWLSQQFF